MSVQNAGVLSQYEFVSKAEETSILESNKSQPEKVLRDMATIIEQFNQMNHTLQGLGQALTNLNVKVDKLTSEKTEQTKKISTLTNRITNLEKEKDQAIKDKDQAIIAKKKAERKFFAYQAAERVRNSKEAAQVAAKKAIEENQAEDQMETDEGQDPALNVALEASKNDQEVEVSNGDLNAAIEASLMNQREKSEEIPSINHEAVTIPSPIDELHVEPKVQFLPKKEVLKIIDNMKYKGPPVGLQVAWWFINTVSLDAAGGCQRKALYRNHRDRLRNLFEKAFDNNQSEMRCDIHPSKLITNKEVMQILNACTFPKKDLITKISRTVFKTFTLHTTDECIRKADFLEFREHVKGFFSVNLE
ncbi:MAG: hypothetical protein H0W88_01140 [Parachlamydiaceae bacterium]|nr:hypothetical protein [Parachlamydiaceae bacterium]